MASDNERIRAKLNLVQDVDGIKKGIDLGSFDEGLPDGERVILVLWVYNTTGSSAAYSFHFERWKAKDIKPLHDLSKSHFVDGFRACVNAGNYAKDMIAALHQIQHFVKEP
jgi:hypothetical protein